MQSAKDSFYVALRDRIAGINPERTLVLRGVTRAGVLVAENELTTTFVAADAFSLEWATLSVDASDGLTRMRCEISYATDGSAENGGMDRGRMLAEMDMELATALRRDPQSVVKTAYTSAGSTTMGMNVFWSDPVFAVVKTDIERLSRTAAVEVFTYGEAGEL